MRYAHLRIVSSFVSIIVLFFSGDENQRTENDVRNKNSKTLFFFALSLLCVSPYIALTQTPSWQWAKSIGSGLFDDASFSLTLDRFGNVYTTGYFTGAVDFDPGPATFILNSTGNTDLFISKLDYSGNFIWAIAIGGTNSVNGKSITLDTFGNVYTTGSFAGTVDFDPGPGTYNLISSGNFLDLFISKLDSLGNFVWAKSINGTDALMAQSIAIDNFNNVYTTGYFTGTVDFDPDSTAIFNLSSLGNNDIIFISKLDSSGNFIWAKAMVGSAADGNSLSIALDSHGNVYTSGYFGGMIDFDPDSSGTFYLTSNAVDIFISKLNSSGLFIWAKSMGGTFSGAESHSISTDDSGNVYSTGYFSGTVDFDPGPGIFNLVNDFGNDIFISKLDSSGDFLWAKSIGNDSSDLLSQSIAIDPSGNIYLTGFYMGTVDLDPDSIRTFSISSTGVVYDVFISKFDNSGNFIWVKEIDGINNDYSYSLAVDGSEHVYVAGYFYSPSLVFGPINLANSDNTGNTLDIFIAKLDTALNTNINEIKNNGAIVFPNPANSQFTITLRNRHKKINIIITDISGKVILTNILTETQRIEIMTKDFIEGIYIVRIQDEDFLEVKKIIIEK